MTLEVPFEGFPEAAKRLVGVGPLFATHENGGTRLTAADPAKNVRVVAFTPDDFGPTVEALRAKGLQVVEGRWMPDDAPPVSGEIHVAAIAYRTEHNQPGLWVDAYPEAPTAVQAIRAMVEEFRDTGEMKEIAVEEFMRLAEPTVVILTPADLRGYAAAKDC